MTINSLILFSFFLSYIRDRYDPVFGEMISPICSCLIKGAMKHKVFNETQNVNSHFFIIIIVNI